VAKEKEVTKKDEMPLEGKKTQPLSRLHIYFVNLAGWYSYF